MPADILLATASHMIKPNINEAEEDTLRKEVYGRGVKASEPSSNLPRGRERGTSHLSYHLPYPKDQESSGKGASVCGQMILFSITSS